MKTEKVALSFAIIRISLLLKMTKTAESKFDRYK